MPTGGFAWLEPEEIEKIDFTSIPDDSPTGYMLEVDLVYPSNIHQEHNSYPLAPESLVVPVDWLSEYQKELLDKRKLDKASIVIAPVYTFRRVSLTLRNQLG